MKREIFLKFYLAFLITALSTTSINALLCDTGCPDNEIMDKFGSGGCFLRTYPAYTDSNIEYCCTISENIDIICENCMVGYKIQGNTCVVDPLSCQVTNCENCVGATCLKCKEGFWLDNFRNLCPPCPRKCAACESENKCTKCKAQTL